MLFFEVYILNNDIIIESDIYKQIQAFFLNGEQKKILH